MRSLVFGLLLISCAGVAYANNFVVYGPGNESCGTYMSNPDDSPLKGLDIEWVMGFITGIGEWQASLKGPPLKSDGNAMQVWLNNYCEAHPLDSLLRATEALSKELVARAYKHE